jgi:hypothetical protein
VTAVDEEAAGHRKESQRTRACAKAIDCSQASQRDGAGIATRVESDQYRSARRFVFCGCCDTGNAP